MSAVATSPVATPGGEPASDNVGSTAPSCAAASLQPCIARLQNLDGSALREEWRRLCRAEPPRISRDLLMRALAYRLQELEFGGLPKWARQSLAGSAAAADPDEAGSGPARKPAPPRLKPGVRLVREWHGRTHTVIVLDDDFEFEGKHYRSLTHIAREITGAHWSGPRFFGLVKRNAGTGSDPASAREAAPDDDIGPRATEVGASAMAAQQDAAGADRSNICCSEQRAMDSAHG